jgi:hypothetical protein
MNVETAEFYSQLKASNIRLVRRAMTHINALNARINELGADGSEGFGKRVLFELVKTTTSCDELRIVVNMLDRLWREDKAAFEETDWPELSRLVSELKGKFERDGAEA